jgi:hypothetical protein
LEYIPLIILTSIKIIELISMPYCTGCGTFNDDDSDFCKKCGRDLKDLSINIRVTVPPKDRRKEAEVNNVIEKLARVLNSDANFERKKNAIDDLCKFKRQGYDKASSALLDYCADPWSNHELRDRASSC